MSEPRQGGGPLRATGERLVPELQHGEVVHAEHLVRHRVAAQVASGRRVLDAACGEGYGTALRAAAGPRSATGVDVDCPERVLSELDRVMDRDVVVVSTPNNHQYLVENEYQQPEFVHEEFVDLLPARFDRVELLLQHNWVASAVLPASPAADVSGEGELNVEFRKLVKLGLGGELYTVALCGRGELPRVLVDAVAATLDDGHELARVVEAERGAGMWHAEYEEAGDALRGAGQTPSDVYGSAWWPITRPLRWLANLVRGRGG